MSGSLIPSPPELCSHVCQLHCLQMLMRILPESILLVIHIISLSTAKTSNKACDMGFFQSLPLQNSIQGVNWWRRMKILGTCHKCERALQKHISFIFINFCYIYSKSLARAICVNKCYKKYIFFIFIHFSIFIQNPWHVPYVSTSPTKR